MDNSSHKKMEKICDSPFENHKNLIKKSVSLSFEAWPTDWRTK